MEFLAVTLTLYVPTERSVNLSQGSFHVPSWLSVAVCVFPAISTVKLSVTLPRVPIIQRVLDHNTVTLR